MLEPASIERIADQLERAHRERERYLPLPEAAAGASLGDAYRVQRALVERWIAEHGQPVGYKIALTSRPMQALVKVDQPLAGEVLAGRVQHYDGVHPVVVALSDFQHVGVEFEVAVRLGQDLSGGGHDRASVAAAVEACCPAFELVEDRNADYQHIDAFSLVADNCWNGGNVLGAAVSDLRAVDLVDGVTELFINDERVGAGRIGDALGHPFDAVAWLANLLHAQGRALRAGELVMTGSSITTRFPERGDRLRFGVAGLGEVQARFE
ncbi:MAG: fumarylacetoacetate hydrolase family protein [Gammaproteobacteria bacterium]|nr:fumarylacetoacetate hydrolase family protein [Gammaproteobacteria bacterium]